MEAPEKLYLIQDNGLICYCRNNKDDIEYTHTNAFIEKACEFLKSYRQDTPDGCGYIAGIVNDKTIEDFKKYMAKSPQLGEQKPFDYEDANIQQKDFAPKSAMEAAKEKKIDNANKVEPKDYNSIDPHFGKPADKA